MDEDGESFSPFWDQTSANRRRGRRVSPSSWLNSGVLIFFLCIVAILFLFFVIPSVLSLTSQIFRPNLVKKSWDSINVVLVLFALLFGFLSRNLNYDSTYSDQENRNEAQKTNPTTPFRWYEYSDRPAFSSAPAGGGLRRTHSSHPDLREATSWDAAEERWRFFDDTQVDTYRALDSDALRRRRSWKRAAEEEDTDREGTYYSKTIHVDKMVARAEEIPPTPPSPPSTTPQEAAAELAPPPPPPSTPPAPLISYHKPRRSYERINHSETINEVKKEELEPLRKFPAPATVRRQTRRVHENVAHGQIGIGQVADQPEPTGRVTSPAPHSVRRKNKRVHETVARRETENGQVVDEPENELSVPLPPPPPPSPPMPHSVCRRPKRTYETVITEKNPIQMEKNPEQQMEAPLQAPPSPPPSEQLSPPPRNTEKKGSKSERKKGTATKDFLLHFQRKKKKKQRQRTVEDIGALFFEPEPSTHSSFPPPSPPPPPPPPPPLHPSSVFNNFFSSKKGKSKRFLSVPPPPPPPPRNPITVARASKSTTQTSQISSGKPPLPVRIKSFTNVEENSNSGGESPITGYGSPMNRIPPPPPPPPFKMPSWKFMVQGDYVRVGSVNSSRSVSPDLEDGESPRSDVSSEVDGGEVAASPLFCPSPDVDTKADMFIAKFRAGLKIQKLNSMKQKQGLGLSNLGPDTKPR